MNRIWKFLTSLRLTAVLLGLGIVLVWVGTVAQADEGLYQAQARYFKHWYVAGATLFGYRVPLLLPGGYLLGTALVVNLVAAHIQRFTWGWKKIGIHLTHVGIIVLLVGQLVTDLLSNETQMRFVEGETKSYSESASAYELAFVSDGANGLQQVVTIPVSRLAAKGEVKHEKLPFAVRVKNYQPNSEPSFRAPMAQNSPPVTSNGIAQFFDFRTMDEVRTMDEKNIPSALIEIVPASGSLGTWMVSGWSGDEGLVEAVRGSYARQASPQMADMIAQRLTTPQTVEVDGKKFAFTLRPERLYTPFSLTLLKATHAVYPGTDIPKDFRSRVRLQNPRTGEDREMEVFMNTPLRYGGLTFFQYQMAAGEAAAREGLRPSSTFQVVRNPGWITPYAGCILVSLGLVVQFMIHLVGFVSKRRST